MTLNETQKGLLRHLHETNQLDDVLLNAAGFSQSTANSLVERGLLRTTVSNPLFLHVVITYHITERGRVKAREGHLCPECGCYTHRSAEKQFRGLCSQYCFWNVFEDLSVYDDDDVLIQL